MHSLVYDPLRLFADSDDNADALFRGRLITDSVHYCAPGQANN